MFNASFYLFIIYDSNVETHRIQKNIIIFAYLLIKKLYKYKSTAPKFSVYIPIKIPKQTKK